MAQSVIDAKTIEAAVAAAFSQAGFKPQLEVRKETYRDASWFSVILQEEGYYHGFGIGDCYIVHQGVIAARAEEGKVLETRLIDAEEVAARSLGLKEIIVPYSLAVKACNFFPCEPDFWYARGFASPVMDQRSTTSDNCWLKKPLEPAQK